MLLYAYRNKSFEGKISWLNPDPELHWQDSLEPPCLTLNQDSIISTTMLTSTPMLPGWSEIIDFELVSTEKESIVREGP